MTPLVFNFTTFCATRRPACKLGLSPSPTLALSACTYATFFSTCTLYKQQQHPHRSQESRPLKSSSLGSLSRTNACGGACQNMTVAKSREVKRRVSLIALHRLMKMLQHMDLADMQQVQYLTMAFLAHDGLIPLQRAPGPYNGRQFLLPCRPHHHGYPDLQVHPHVGT